MCLLVTAHFYNFGKGVYELRSNVYFMYALQVITNIHQSFLGAYVCLDDLFLPGSARAIQHSWRMALTDTTIEPNIF